MMTVFFLFLPRSSHPQQTRLDLHVREKIRALDGAATGAHALDRDANPSPAHRHRRLAQTAVDLRRQHAIDGTEIERRRLRAEHDHGENADALGTGHRHRAARATNSNCTTTGKKSPRTGALSKKRARSRASPRRPRSPFLRSGWRPIAQDCARSISPGRERRSKRRSRRKVSARKPSRRPLRSSINCACC